MASVLVLFLIFGSLWCFAWGAAESIVTPSVKSQYSDPAHASGLILD